MAEGRRESKPRCGFTATLAVRMVFSNRRDWEITAKMAQNLGGAIIATALTYTQELFNFESCNSGSGLINQGLGLLWTV
jgi:hypothetical protein